MLLESFCLDVMNSFEFDGDAFPVGFVDEFFDGDALLVGFVRLHFAFSVELGMPFCPFVGGNCT